MRITRPVAQSFALARDSNVHERTRARTQLQTSIYCTWLCRQTETGRQAERGGGGGRGVTVFYAQRERERDSERETQRERERESSKTLSYKDCSLGSVKNLFNN